MASVRSLNASYDVIIAGAGPAGSALAIQLATSGLKVLLADAQRFPRDKPCGDFVSPKGLALLDALGCSAEIHALGSHGIRESRLYLDRKLLVAGAIPHVQGLLDHGLALPRKALDDILFRRAASAGAHTAENCAVRGFVASGSGVEVDCLHEGRAWRPRARLLIGADGANSSVARAAELRMNDARHSLASVRAYVHGLSVPHTLMYFDEEFFPGYGWIFPVRTGLCNIGVGMVKETIVRDGLRLPEFYERFKKKVLDFARARAMHVDIEPHQGWPIRSYGGATRNYFDGGLLIGEAACFVDPINGEGIPLALESASIAARTIRRAFDRGNFSTAVLANYEREWRARFDPDLEISDLVVSMIRNRDLLSLWLALFRTMSLTARDDPSYAAVTGGILAGVVPAREALVPEMFVRALAHKPSFWREVCGFDGTPDFVSLLQSGAHWLHWQKDLMQKLLSGDEWSRAWLREIVTKQARLAARNMPNVGAARAPTIWS